MVSVRYWAHSLLMALLLMWTYGDPSADMLQLSHGCLYGVTVGHEATPVTPCDDADPLNLAKDPYIGKVMRSLSIEPGKVRFKGCKGLRFSATPDGMAKEGDRRYLITYPIEITQSYLAPITHELAHVLQMEMAGGLDPLRKTFSSMRVELGADFLAGVIFSSSLQTIDINQFQHNLELMGLYVELETDAHGTPAQRTSAFRWGVHLNFDAMNRDIRIVNEDFQANIYGKVVQF